MDVLRVYQRAADIRTGVLDHRWPTKTQPTVEGKRLSHSYVNSYESSNREEKMTLWATSSQSRLIVSLSRPS